MALMPSRSHPIETASRVMSQFRKERLIASGRRWVALAVCGRLAAIARSGSANIG
jgi:hypothetical protein